MYEKTIIGPVYVVISGGWITADGSVSVNNGASAKKGETVTITVKPGKTVFVDVPDNSWYADAADFAAQRGLMSGVGENLFGGSQNTTRAEMAVMLQQFVKLTEK